MMKNIMQEGEEYQKSKLKSMTDRRDMTDRRRMKLNSKKTENNGNGSQLEVPEDLGVSK